MDIDQRALDLAKHLLDIETKSKIRKNKRSPSDIDKFIKSTQWLSKRILSNYAASKKHKLDYLEIKIDIKLIAIMLMVWDMKY